MKEDYYPISSHTVIPGTVVSFDIFSKGTEKMELCCTSGDNVREETLKKIYENNITELYIRKLNKKNYFLYLEEVLETIIHDPDISTSVKAKTTYDTIMNLAYDLFKTPNIELEFIQRYKHTIYDITEFILNENDALKSLINLTTFDYTICNHSVNVGIFSSGLAKELFENDHNHEFEDIAAGFFLHDIGKTTISQDILNKKSTLLKADWTIIKKHPVEGVKILEKFNEQTEVINDIILQHHERLDGKGYPKGLKGNQINLFSKICSIADTFDGLTSYRPYRKEKSTFIALKIMKNEMFKYFEPEFFAKFVKLLSN